MSNTVSMWYKPGLNMYLSSVGFKHFAIGEGIDDDFENGRAFYFDLNSRKFGLKDMINCDELDCATALSNEFESTGKISKVEQL